MDAIRIEGELDIERICIPNVSRLIMLGSRLSRLNNSGVERGICRDSGMAGEVVQFRA
jgi:hypothetical protein